jgi:hypothetical protein
MAIDRKTVKRGDYIVGGACPGEMALDGGAVLRAPSFDDRLRRSGAPPPDLDEIRRRLTAARAAIEALRRK